MQSQTLTFEPLTAAQAEELYPVLTTPAVLAWIEPPGYQPTLEEFRADYALRARGFLPGAPTASWFNVVIRLKEPPAPAIGRLEAACWGEWGEVAYLFGEAWWGRGLAFEAMSWWQEYLAVAAPGTEWWAAVHPENSRSLRLLARLGWEEQPRSQAPNLGSYDPGDTLLRRKRR